MQNDETNDGRRIVLVALGTVFIAAAALLCASLLFVLFPLDGSAGWLLLPGEILLAGYGYSSFLVPAFLLGAAIALFVPGWSLRAGVLFASFPFPFFTVALAEALYGKASVLLAGSILLSGAQIGIVLTALFTVFGEILASIHIADLLLSKNGVGSKSNHAGETPQDSGRSTEEPDYARPRASTLSDPLASPVPATADGEDVLAAPEALYGIEVVSEENETGDSKASLDDDFSFPDVNAGKPSFEDPLMKTIAEAEEEAGIAPEAESIPPQAESSPESRMPSGPASEAVLRATEPVPSVPASSEAPTSEAPTAAVVKKEIESPVYVDFSRHAVTSTIEDLDVLSDDILPDEELADEFVSEPVHEEFSAGENEAPLQDDPIPGENFDEADQPDGEPEFAADNEADLPDPYLAEEEISDDDMADEDLDDEDLVDEDLVDEDLADDFIDDVLFEEAAESPAVSLPEEFSSPPAHKAGASYRVPVEILTSYPDGEYWIIDDATRRAAAALKDTLNEFRIQADVTGIRKGPVITMFEILPAPGVKLSRIVGLQDNIALRLAASSVRIVAPIPGKHAVGIEVPNVKRAIVSFRELIETDTPSAKKMEIPVVLGKDISGEAQLLDLASTPHLLIAGSTGSGKSVCVNSIILSILYKRSPEEVKLLLIDPKIVELKLYNDIGHLLSPVITEPKKAFQALQYCLCEMERRYAMLDGMGVRDIKSYNRRIRERNIATERLPYIVVIIDEFADLMATTGKELESTVARLCAMSRAVGIHLVLATQRPSIDVITGLIKANIPTRIAFMVASKMDSRIIIDQVGAEKLLGRGDMLYASATDPFPVRIQGAFVSEEEVEHVVEFVKTLGEPDYIDEEIFVEDDEEGDIDASLFSEGDDPLYDKALEIVVLAGKASASYIQRKLKIGYNRAARLVEEMEERGIVGPANGSKPREVIHIPGK